MTAELKTVLDAYLQWCRENQELCEVRVTDINMKHVNMLCDMYLSIHPPDLADLEQYTPRTRTATKAAEIFMHIVEDMSESTGMDRENVFRYLLQL